MSGPSVETGRPGLAIPKTAGSLDGNFLRGSAERPIFLRTTLS
jgi:hypothetical protein